MRKVKIRRQMWKANLLVGQSHVVFYFPYGQRSTRDRLYCEIYKKYGSHTRIVTSDVVDVRFSVDEDKYIELCKEFGKVDEIDG